MRTDPTSNSISKIAGLTLVNALVFQEVLADYESQVQHLRQTLQSSDAITAFADTQVSRAKAQFGELSPEELKAVRATAEAQFSDTLRTYRKRRHRALNRALECEPRFAGLMHPVPEYYLCAGHLTAFYRCVIFWNKDGEQRVVIPELPFTVDGTVTLP